MRWLLTIGKEVDLGKLGEDLADIGLTVDPSSPLPLGDARVVSAEGPEDVPARLAQAGMRNVLAYPDSELELYDED